MVGREASPRPALRVVVDDELDRVEHGDPALGARVEVVAHRRLEQRDVDPRIGARHADAVVEQAEALRREAAPARADDRRHPRIVPAVDVALVDELEQLALRQHDVGQVEPRELVLVRQRPLELAAVGELADHPVVQRAMVLELERADRMRDPLERIRDAMRVVVQRIDAPRVAGAVMPTRGGSGRSSGRAG